MARNPIAQGSLVAIAAALLFGVTTPLVEHFGRGVGPFATATLLYAGAALGAGLPRRRGVEQAVRAAQMPRVALVALFGAVLATLLAIHVGFTAVVMAALVLYGVAAATRP